MPTRTAPRSQPAATLAVHHPADVIPVPGRLDPDGPRVSVVIPTKNEARNLPWVFERLPVGVAEVILVDAQSTDGTVELARSLRDDVVVIQQTRRGKGNALACAFEVATGDILVMLDADGSAHPAEILRFVRALEDGADFAKGSRFLRGGGSADITRIRRWGNAVLSGLVNRLFGTGFTDLCYGYNAFWVHCLPYLELPAVSGTEPVPGDGFEIETLINVRVAQSPLVVTEVASYESSRLHGVSNLNAVRDGLRVLRVILAERKLSRRLRRDTAAAEVFVPYPTEPLNEFGKRRMAYVEDVA
ncbi:MAG: glycosyltransferase family 2 protein [Frankiaceae bacterium]|nr:glycosyltransferase family 2 protein [Frankiaceae bacterium]MBV9369630.1 glycosyltransferase family 2 protein [Frankiales bacterium]